MDSWLEGSKKDADDEFGAEMSNAGYASCSFPMIAQWCFILEKKAWNETRMDSFLFSSDKRKFALRVKIELRLYHFTASPVEIWCTQYKSATDV